MTSKKHNISFFLYLSIVWFFISGFRFVDTDSRNTISYFLFKIERSRNADEIYYDINLNSNGELNTRNPINIYWIKKTAGGIKEGLTWIQKRFGYGLKYVNTSNSQINFHFVSHLKREFILKKDKNGDFKVFTTSKNITVEVKKLFIQFDGGTFLSPKIFKVELYATIPDTGKEIIEIINP